MSTERDPKDLDTKQYGHTAKPPRGQKMYCGICGRAVRRLLGSPDWVHA